MVENSNRVIRILKESSTTPISEKYFVEEIEKTLYNRVNGITKTNDYNDYLNQLTSLNSTVSEFFDKVLVMDKNENIKNNRISLLTLLKEKYDYLTDFSKVC